MKSIVLAAVAASGLLLAGCDRYTGPTQVSGTVQDAHTRQGVPNATVQVLGARTSGSSTSPGGVVQARTDASGRYSLSFEAQAHELYQMQAYSASGYTPLSTPYVDGGRKTENMAVLVSAPAWVKINCVDDPPLGRMWLTTSGYSYSPSGISDSQWVGPGNFYFVRPTASYSSERSLYWKLTDPQGSSREGRIPYTTMGLDTVTVTVHF